MKYVHLVCLLSMALLHACQSDPDKVDIDISNNRQPVITIFTTDELNEHDVISRVRVRLEDSNAKDNPGVLLNCQVQSGGYVITPSVMLHPLNSYVVSVNWNGKLYEQHIRPNDSIMGANVNVSIECFPMSAEVPMNILQFHVLFSQPMMRDYEAYTKIQIVDAQGDTLPKIWREKSDWSNDRKHLALMIHPGRVKHGIVYLGDEGPLFKPGESYSLILTQPLMVEGGTFIQPRLLKKFAATDADTSLPSHLNYTWNSEKMVFEITFSEPMDFGTLRNGIQLRDSSGDLLFGQLSTSDDKQWTYTLSNKLHQQPKHVELEKFISDLASNRFNRPFEVKKIEDILLDEKLELPLSN